MKFVIWENGEITEKPTQTLSFTWSEKALFPDPSAAVGDEGASRPLISFYVNYITKLFIFYKIATFGCV